MFPIVCKFQELVLENSNIFQSNSLGTGLSSTNLSLPVRLMTQTANELAIVYTGINIAGLGSSKSFSLQTCEGFPKPSISLSLLYHCTQDMLLCSTIYCKSMLKVKLYLAALANNDNSISPSSSANEGITLEDLVLLLIFFVRSEFFSCKTNMWIF